MAQPPAALHALLHRTLPLAVGTLLVVLTSTACTVSPLSAPARQALLPADVLLLGEQHDAPEHQQWQKDTVQWLAQRGQLAALVMEMAEQGRSTQGLAPDASEAAVQKALFWSDANWPWADYGPVAMAAVRASVPVLGGNLPRKQINAATTDTRLDTRVPAPVWQRQQEAVRAGHCDLLPARMLPGMVRVQIARDVSLAQTAAAAHQPGKVVLLVAGVGHVQRSVGVPLHLPHNLVAKVAVAQAGEASEAVQKEADWVHITPALPPKDVCAPLRQQWPAKAAPP